MNRPFQQSLLLWASVVSYWRYCFFIISTSSSALTDVFHLLLDPISLSLPFSFSKHLNLFLFLPSSTPWCWLSFLTLSFFCYSRCFTFYLLFLWPFIIYLICFTIFVRVMWFNGPCFSFSHCYSRFLSLSHVLALALFLICIHRHMYTCTHAHTHTLSASWGRVTDVALSHLVPHFRRQNASVLLPTSDRSVASTLASFLVRKTKKSS